MQPRKRPPEATVHFAIKRSRTKILTTRVITGLPTLPSDAENNWFLNLKTGAGNHPFNLAFFDVGGFKLQHDNHVGGDGARQSRQNPAPDLEESASVERPSTGQEFSARPVQLAGDVIGGLQTLLEELKQVLHQSRA